MKRGRQHIGLKSGALAVILLLGIVAFNRTANLHRHYLGGGITITHAHPYDKSADSSPFKSHSHGEEGPFATDGMVELVMPVPFYEGPHLAAQFTEYSDQGLYRETPEKYGIPGSRGPPRMI
jgi:hypothetical protein